MNNDTPNPYSPPSVDYSPQPIPAGQLSQMANEQIGDGFTGFSGMPYGSPYGGKEGELPSSKFNVLAIVAFISAFFIPIVAVVTGHISLSQVKKTGARGRGLAIWGNRTWLCWNHWWNNCDHCACARRHSRRSG